MHSRCVASVEDLKPDTLKVSDMADYSKTLLAALNRQSKKDSQAKYEFVVVDPDTLKFTIDFKPSKEMPLLVRRMLCCFDAFQGQWSYDQFDEEERRTKVYR